MSTLLMKLSDMLSSRIPCAAADDPAVVVLGERLYGLCVALQIPSRDWLWIAQWCDGPEFVSIDALDAYLDVLVAERCWRPGEDLISDLIVLEADGDGLTADEIRAIIVGLLLP